MTYRRILVPLDQTPLASSRVRAGVGLAKRLKAHLQGVAPTGLVELPASAGGASRLAEFAAMAWDELRESALRCTATFRAECERAQLASFDACVDDSEKTLSWTRHARCSDLCVLSQALPGAPDASAQQATLEHLVLQSGRPCLILPSSGKADLAASHVLIAWDGSREAARAVADAMPLLARAARVNAVSWNEGKGDADPVLAEHLARLESWLNSHGVNPIIEVQPIVGDIGRSILSKAAQLGSDLIVMGAYGHARWAERVLGGASRSVLARAGVPVLMSH